MGKTRRRCTDFFLSLVILLLGGGSIVLLYYAGQKAIDAFWGPDATYMDEMNRIHRHEVTDEWYGLLVLRGWAFGLMYVAPGVSGIVAALFFNRPTMIVHLVIAIAALFFGSFLHSAGGVALLLYRLLVVEGATRYDPMLGDCIYINDNALIKETFQDQNCLDGRKALELAIGAVCVLCLAWIFTLTNVIYCAFSFSSLRRSKKVKITSDRTRLIDDTCYQSNAEAIHGATGTTEGPRRHGPRSRSPWRRGRTNKKVLPPVAPELPTSQEQTPIFPQPSSSAVEDTATVENEQVTIEVAKEATPDSTNQSTSPEEVEMSLAVGGEPNSYENKAYTGDTDNKS